MTALVLRIDNRADALRAIHTFQQTGCEHRVPVIQAVLDGRIAHYEVRRDTSGKLLKQFLAAARGPALLLVGDDDGEAGGPAEWAQAQRMLHWAHVVILHATGAEVWHYRLAVEAAELHGRVLLVECNTVTLDGWLDATRRWASRAAVQILRVPPGQPAHPAAEMPRVMQ